MENAVTNGALQHAPQIISPAREVRVVQDAIPILDTARFEHMQRIATAMAKMTVGLPECLWKGKDDSGTLVQFPPDVVQANCFKIVNQAVRWGMDPFGLAEVVSIVHGRMCYEGKAIHAAIEGKTGIRLNYRFSEHAPGDQQLTVTVFGQFPDEDEVRDIEGTVAQWHKGSSSPWASPADWKRQLRYRGAREWARAHAPSVMLGVYSPDELDDLRENRRIVEENARPSSIAPPPPPQYIAAPKPPAPPAPPAAVRKTDVVDAEPVDDKKPAAAAGSQDAGEKAGPELQGRRAPAAPPPPPPRVTGAASGGAPTKLGERYMAKLENGITSADTMVEVDALWTDHLAFVKANPSVLSADQVGTAEKLYADAKSFQE